MLKKWENLPENLRTEQVRPYYEALQKKQFGLFCKRVFDIFVSAVMLLILSPVFLVLAVAIKLDSPGPVFYRQVRVTRYGETFRIFKFRSMRVGSDKGSLVTIGGHDPRVTRSGYFIRKFKIDELPQLINVFTGDMSLV